MLFVFPSINRLSILLLLGFTFPVYGQAFKITPNNNQYYFTDYIQKREPGSILKIVLLINITDGYKSTLTNPQLSWSDWSGSPRATMTGTGKYQIDLDVVYKKKDANTIALSEFKTPRVIDIKIGDLERHLIRIDYVSDLTVENIVKKISVFNPMESRYDDLIGFIYEYNEVLRKYDPFCDLVLPEIITDDFSRKITQSIRADWKKTKINVFQSTSKSFSKFLNNDPGQSIAPGIIDYLSQANDIRLNYYNAYRIDYVTRLMEYCLANPEKNCVNNDLIIKSFEAIKQDSTDRNLIITHVVRNGFQINNLFVAYTPVINPNPDIISSQKEYFKIPTSPSFNIFSSSEYTLWVEDKEKQKVSTDKTVNCIEDKFREIVLPVNSSLAIVKLQNVYGKDLNFDVHEFERDLKSLMIKYNGLFLSHVALPVKEGVSRK